MPPLAQLSAPSPGDPRRIVRIITRLNIGGPSIQAIHLSYRLVAAGFHTVLVHGQLGEGEGDMRYLLPEQVETRFVAPLKRPVSPLSDLKAFWRIFRILCEVRPALVHTHMAKAGTVGRLAALAYNLTRGLRSPVRVVHTYHGHIFEGYFRSRLTAFFVLIERVLASVTDRLVAISPGIRRELLEQHHIGREAQYEVVPLGFDLAPFAAITSASRLEARHALGLTAHAPVIATVGRLTAIKDHQLFLDMAVLVAARHPDAIFLIAGDGELRSELERAAGVAGLAGRVRFLGWRRDLPALYAAIDVFVITSRNEGTPVALIEAMAAGVPGVSTDVGGVSDVITDGSLGILVPFGDATALSDAVCRLLRSPEERAQMGQRARASVLARYTLDRLVGHIANLYRSLLERDRAQSPAKGFAWKIFLIALAVRLAYVLLYPQPTPLCGDCRIYDEVGRHMASGLGFVGGYARETLAGVIPGGESIPEVGIGPIYPAFLAAIYRVFGHGFTAVRVVQSILGAATVLILCGATSLALGAAVGRRAAILAAFYPPFIIYTGMLLTETLFAFFLVLGIWVLTRAVNTQSMGLFGVAGLLMGTTILLREEALLMSPFLLILIFWKHPSKRMFERLGLFVLVTAVSVGGWTVRNYLTFGEFILVSGHGGDTLWISAKGWTEWHMDDAELQSIVRGKTYTEQNNALRRDALRLIAQDPLHYVALCFKRIPQFWVSSHTSYLVGFSGAFRDYYGGRAYGVLLVKGALLALNLGLVALGFWGVISVLSRGSADWLEASLLLLPIAVIATAHFILFAAPRYQVPIMPFLLSFAAVPWWRASARPGPEPPGRFE